MTEYDQILKVKEDAEARLRTIPGVHAVGISKKVVQGKPTGELCIVVFLVQKKPLDRLAPQEVVPPEIDGIKTDVVEMEVPRLLMAADPANLIATIAPDKQSVTFSSPTPGVNKPGGGLLIALAYSFGPVHHNVWFITSADMTLSNIASGVAAAVKANDPVIVKAAAVGAQMTLTPTAPNLPTSIDRCAVTAIDDKQYSGEYLRGGIQIGQGQSLGTLGCLATTAPTATDPHGKVVAITCHHVVGSFDRRDSTNLTASVQSTPEGGAGNEITFSGTDPIPLDTLVLVDITLDEFPDLEELVLYSTVAGDAAPGIAKSVASAITNLNVVALSATARGPVVTIFGGTASCEIYGPPVPDSASHLQARVVGLAIDFTGDVAGDDYGIFVNINPGGMQSATFGVYTNPAQGSKLSAIAQSIAKLINDLPIVPVRGGVTADSSGARVTVSNAQEVECTIKSDIRVGQPYASFGSSCSSCLNQRIGRVLDARIDVDAALVQLDAGQKYKPEIQDLAGVLTGTYDLQLSDVHQLDVSKRGRTSGLTVGTVDALNVSGQAGPGVHRLYVNAARIAAKPGADFFALPGDSGSAVFRDHSVVGILFLRAGKAGLMTPIAQISAAFPSLALNVAPAPEAGHAPGDVRVVPAAAMAAVAPHAAPAAAALAPFFGQRLAQAEREIAATPAGAEVTELVKRHFAEALHLVNSNRRVATAWHRAGGPQILEAALRVLQLRDQRLPEEIDGKPFGDCLARIGRALARYASPSLAADLSRLAPRLARFSGLTYTQVLSALQAGSAE